MTGFPIPSTSSDWKFSNHRAPRKYFWLLQENLSAMWPQLGWWCQGPNPLEKLHCDFLCPMNSEKRQLLWMLCPLSQTAWLLLGKSAGVRFYQGKVMAQSSSSGTHRRWNWHLPLTWWRSTAQSALEQDGFATFPSDTVSLHRQSKYGNSPRLRFMRSNDATERRHLSRLWGALDWPTQTQKTFTPFFLGEFSQCSENSGRIFHNPPSFPVLPMLCSPGHSPVHLRGSTGEPKVPHKSNLQHFLSPHCSFLHLLPPGTDWISLSQLSSVQEDLFGSQCSALILPLTLTM